MNPQPGEHVVHIGGGTGYYPAVFAERVTEAGAVTAIEIVGFRDEAAQVTPIKRGSGTSDKQRSTCSEGRKGAACRSFCS